MTSGPLLQATERQTLLLGAALREAPSQVAIVSSEGRIVAVNESWREFAAGNGGEPDAVGEGADYLAACESAPEELGAATAAALRGILAGEKEGFSLEYPCHSPDEKRWFLGLFKGFSHAGERFAAVTHVDITQRKMAEDEARESALRDRLTGLPNRTLLLDRLQHEVARSSREPEYGFALLFLDVDDFKSVNDGMGHLVGDELLVSIAERIRGQLRHMDTLSRGSRGDTPARLGGDEFIVLLEGVTREEDAAQIVERLLGQLKEPHRIGGKVIRRSASVGVRLCCEACEPEDVLRDADAAMYRAKAEGPGRYSIHRPQSRVATLPRVV